MAFTQSQLDALETAIAQGTLRVRFADREVIYRSLDEMKQIRDMMKRELYPTSKNTKAFAVFKKGT